MRTDRMRLDWMADALCKGRTDLDWTPKVEAREVPAAIRAVCDACPVRLECRMYALATRTDHDYWGGLSTYQRRQLERKRSRVKCPVCPRLKDEEAQAFLVRIEGEDGAPVHEMCLRCGWSWEAETVPKLRDGKPVPRTLVPAPREIPDVLSGVVRQAS